MTRAFLDLHVLQSVPPSNINRDDTGSPKTAVYGGVTRARVSSQAWKHAIRKSFEELLDTSEIGVRSKRLIEKISEEIAELSPDLKERSQDLAADVLTVAGITLEKAKKAKNKLEDRKSLESSYLIFLSNLQINNLAVLAVRAEQSGEKLDKKEVIAAAKSDHSVDIALFGRMVADIVDLRVDAAAQVAHAISVHGVENEYDYFTAVDDNASGDHAGAGMIGTVEFNSSTLYRYATVNLGMLKEHLGDAEATARAVEAFVRAFITSLPTGKQNTFANRTLPNAVVVSLRTDQPVNLVGAFEDAVVVLDSGSRLAVSTQALVDHTKAVETSFNSQPKQTWVIAVGAQTSALSALGEPTDMNSLIAGVSDAVKDELREDA